MATSYFVLLSGLLIGHASNDLRKPAGIVFFLGLPILQE